MSAWEQVRGFWSRLLSKRVRTKFGTARVYDIRRDGRDLRVLDVDGTFQSAMYLEEEHWCDPPFPYLANFDSVFERDPEPLDLCMLGGGGYAFPRHVLAHHQNARIDVVEVDPTVTALAFEHFRLDEARERFCGTDPDRLGLICSDAITHLRDRAATDRHYDAILNDCFAAGLPDTSLATRESAQLVHQNLTSCGIYATNAICALEGPEAKPLLDLVSALCSSFEHVLAIPSNRVPHDERDNTVVLATDDASFLPSGSIRLYDSL